MIYKNNNFFLDMIRYSCIQLFHYVVKNIYKDIKFAESDITDVGFYCDIDSKYSLKIEDLNIIQKNMLHLSSKKYNIIHKIISKNLLLDSLSRDKEFYQIEIINKKFKEKKIIDVYCHEKYLEFSRGLQVSNIKFCKYIILQKISGIYWKNNNQNKMLQRIYGVAWENKRQLHEYLLNLENLERFDHRKLAKKLDFYHIYDKSPGMIFWHHNGYIVFRQLKKFIRSKLKKYNYQEVSTPFILDQSLWEKSGHWNYYQDSMFTTCSENKLYCIKPMNCPAHVLIFKQGIKSYRDLPLRLSEFGSCHRNESSGSLHGLLRIRSFTQDDAHIFCTKEQIKSELSLCMIMLHELYKIFSFKKVTVTLSTRPKKRIGSEEIWDKAEEDLKSVLLEQKISYISGIGQGAFYGPKIEISLHDRFNRIWQCGTIQLDFSLSNQLDAHYIDKDNIRKPPVIIHRALLGSIERFIGILLEEYQGKLPIWLSPIQVVVINISEKHILLVKKITKKLLKFNIRAIFDIKNVSLNSKIRKYITECIPYLLICGDQELKNNFVTVRNMFNKESFPQKIDIFIQNILQKIFMRSL